MEALEADLEKVHLWITCAGHHNANKSNIYFLQLVHLPVEA